MNEILSAFKGTRNTSILLQLGRFYRFDYKIISKVCQDNKNCFFFVFSCVNIFHAKIC